MALHDARSLISVLACFLIPALVAACARGVDRAAPDHPAPSPPGPHAGLMLRDLEHHGRPRRYAVFIPPGTPPERGWPVILFLHGSGERGQDGLRPAGVGLIPVVLTEPERWPAVIVVPQCPPGQRWVNDPALPMAALDRVLADERADRGRIALTGLSMGAQGAWELASRWPERFSAVAAVCGFRAPGEDARALARLPVWAFHGEQDTVVPVADTLGVVEAIRAAGGTPRLTLYPEAGHNAWDSPQGAAYRDEGLAPWLLSGGRP
jgi:predicted peptidase